jgi:pseudaminic acid biosynthesis-associated methylase
MNSGTDKAKRLSEQEQFWAGEFGDSYQERNQGEDILAAKTAAFSHILWRAGAINSLIEFGPNLGLNLIALRRLLPRARFAAVEINASAAGKLRALGGIDVVHDSISKFEPQATFDLVLSSGVLIHIAPDDLPAVYERMYRSCGRYIALFEYYNPTPVEIEYRGHKGKLFKRDFAGDLMEKYPDLKLVDYGFIYQRQPNFPMGDGTWFLLEKR